MPHLTEPNFADSWRGRKVALIVNQGSRSGPMWYEQAKEKLTAGGITFERSTLFRKTAGLIEATHRAVDAGIEVIIVGGGDGTLGAAAQVLLRKPVAMGVLPSGTGNAFARDLGVGLSVEAACHTILTGVPKSVDVGLIDDQVFLNVATVGLSTRIALGLRSLDKKRFGQSVYLISLLRGLASVRPFRVELRADGVESYFDSLQVVIGNGRFHAGPLVMAKEASLSDGWLTVYALASKSRGAFLMMTLHSLNGTQGDLADVKSFRAHAGTLVTTPRRRVTVDGEVTGQTPINFRELPGVLRVIVPNTIP